MFDASRNSTTEQERTILRKLRVWIAALAVACLLAGIGIGAMLSGRPTKAQPDTQISRAPEALSASFAEIARRVEPAVVNIETTQASVDPADKDDDDKDDQSATNPLLDMFRKRQRSPTRGVGSGFIVSPKGYILTNYHVIEDAARITVGLQSGEKYRGTVVGFDPETDVAVLKIEPPKDLPTVTLGDSNAAQVGDWVLAMGSPFGLDQTVTAGIISKKERESPFFNVFQRFLQTDAAINRGNSGGPLVNMRGEVIGMNSQIATSTGDYNGIGFALPANETNFVYKQLIAQGKVKRGYLGITLESVHEEFAKVYGISDPSGAIVTDLRDKLSPAGRAGLQVGDIIVEFGGKKIKDAGDLITRVSSASPDETIGLVYLREVGQGLERRTTEIKLAERLIETRANLPESERRKLGPESPRANNSFGLTLSDLTPTLASSYKLEGQRGVVVKEVNPESYIADVKVSNGSEGFSEGDLIRRINRVAVTDMKTFNAAVAKLKPGDAVVMEVISYSPSGRSPQLKIVQFTVQ